MMLASAYLPASAQAAELALVGQRIDDFALQDFRGKKVALSEYADKEAVVVYFLGTECPIAKLYGARVQKLADQFGPKGVAFVGVSSNMQDSLAESAAHARSHESGVAGRTASTFLGEFYSRCSILQFDVRSALNNGSIRGVYMLYLNMRTSPVGKFPPNQTRLATFDNPLGQPWDGMTAHTGAYVRRTGPKTFDVFASAVPSQQRRRRLPTPPQWFGSLANYTVDSDTRSAVDVTLNVLAA
jgi:hypothetical protein